MEEPELQAPRANRSRVLPHRRLEHRSTEGERGNAVPPSRVLRRVQAVLIGTIGLAALLAGASWVLTADLEAPEAAATTPLPETDRTQAAEAEERVEAIDWPAERLEGQAAKKRLLAILLAVRERLKTIPGYTCTLRRQERIDGELGPSQTIAMKVRHHPFGVYLRFLEPEEGREAIYQEGHYDNCVIAHPGGLGRAFLPRLKVPPDSKLALAGNRHPITDAGILNLTEKLIGYREMDLTDDEAITVLDHYSDADGRTWLRSVHDHPTYQSERPFQYVEILYEPETRLPVRITSYDWPEPGQPAGERKLAERYFYDDLDLDATLSDLDFDPANPDYEFRRF